MTRNFLHILVALQVAALNIQWNIWRIEYTMEKHEEIRYNSLDRIRYKYLVAIQLNLIALDLEVFLHLWEKENSGEVEWIIHIQVNIEERIFECGRV